MVRAKPPKEVEVLIESVATDGLGVATLGERTVRVKNGLAGETVRARVLKRRRGNWLAEADVVAGADPSRTTPGCAWFPRCGGCVMQHMDYGAQIALKQARLNDALTRQGVVAATIDPPTLGPRYHYRTRARFGVRMVGDQLLLGFRESFSNRVGRMDACATLTVDLSRLIDPLKKLIAGLSCADRIPQVEVAAGDSCSAVIIRHLETLSSEDIGLIERFAGIERVDCYGQSGGYETLRLLGHAPGAPTASADGASAGDGDAEARLGYANPDYGLHFRFGPADFTQVNLGMNRKLVRAAVTLLRAPAGAGVLDLFCGIGNFSLALAASGLRVLGMEAVEDSVARARMNARRNGLGGRCEFAVRDLYDAGCASLPAHEYLLLDPPRSGAGPNLREWVASAGVERISYVSCSPESFATDAAVLAGSGFELERVGLFDMFPHTAHVETLGVFQKRW